MMTERRRNYLVSESNHHTTKQFSENLYVIEMEKGKIPMNKPVYLGPSVVDIRISIIVSLSMII